jgi:non-canonical purine NTP pyrophosphatase (RdgB/HAM1 family)
MPLTLRTRLAPPEADSRVPSPLSASAVSARRPHARAAQRLGAPGHRDQVERGDRLPRRLVRLPVTREGVGEVMLGIEVTAVKADLAEIQDLDVGQVATRKAADAFAQVGEPVLVDDTGLSIDGWNGLPGALVVWFIETVGAEGILKMAEGLTSRRATAVTALGYADASGVRVFRGMVDGSIATELRGTSGFGFDPISSLTATAAPSRR